MKSHATHKRHIIFLALLLFIVTQYSAMVHASAHFFHTPDQLCSIYSAIEHDKGSVVTHNLSVAFITTHSESQLCNNTIDSTAYFIFLPARAPPQNI